MKKNFLTGLATLLPVAVTVWAVLFIVNLLTHPFIGAVNYFLTLFPSLSQHIPQKMIGLVSQLIILITLIVFTFFLGLIARRYFFHRLLELGSFLVEKIPLVNTIYKTSKDIIESLFNTKNQSFKQVVLLPFPYQGAYCLGLITSNAPNACQRDEDNSLVSVFIPTTPNPTTGYLVLRPQKDLILLSMTIEEAIQYIISCAVIQPEYNKEPT